MIMIKNKTHANLHPGNLLVFLGFVATFCFFQFAYPYHLIRREQMNLFLFDWNYIFQTYNGAGWLSRFTASFFEQFFHLPVVGPLVVACLLTATAIVPYRICRHFSGLRTSAIIAFLVFVWSFLRETGNLYVTRYTIVMLGYLSMVLLALQFKGVWRKAVMAVLLAIFGIWSLGAPFNSFYGKAWGIPRINYDRIIGLDTEVARENWEKVLKMSEKDLFMTEASYCYNLAHAIKGDLGDCLFDHSQAEFQDLLFPVSVDNSTFTNCLAGELWYQLGEMTIAEQSAITTIQASPEHTGARYIERLAKVNLIKGEDAAAQKYLNLLSRTLFYGKWAGRMLSGQLDEKEKTWLDNGRKNLAFSDFVHHSDVPQDVLSALLEANPSNSLARTYLLVFNLLRYDLDRFIQDYSADKMPGHIYKEAVLIWLSQQNKLTDETAAEFDISVTFSKKMESFFRYPENYKNTYWYYYSK